MENIPNIKSISTCSAGYDNLYIVTTALCEDGSVWTRDYNINASDPKGEWVCINQPTKRIPVKPIFPKTL